jgi:hypothetical protein
MQIMWAWTVGTQLFVLVWSQFFVPLLYAYGLLTSWKAGTTGEWAYLLLGACLGTGPLVLRNGPGAMSADRLTPVDNTFDIFRVILSVARS